MGHPFPRHAMHYCPLSSHAFKSLFFLKKIGNGWMILTLADERILLIGVCSTLYFLVYFLSNTSFSVFPPTLSKYVFLILRHLNTKERVTSTKLGVFIDSLWACFVVVLNYSFELKSKLAYIYPHKLTPLLELPSLVFRHPNFS